MAPFQLWYNRQGEPITVEAAVKLLTDLSYVRVALTRITSRTDPAVDLRVSTVWRASNMAMPGFPPTVFETMTFGPRGEEQGQTLRYSTEAQAVAGHANVVEETAAAIPDAVLDDWRSDPNPTAETRTTT